MTEKGESTRNKILDVGEAMILEKGFAGTSLNDVLQAAEMTKGAFFYHFKNKDEMARAILDNYINKDLAAFEGFSEKAEKLAEDPLQETLIFLKLFEEYLVGLDAPPPGCVLASYTYEQSLLELGVQTRVREAFETWSAYYEQKFEKLIAWRNPKIPVTARDLSETIMAIVEGGFLISRSYNDKTLTIRLSKQFRNYLKLLFETS